MLKRLVIGRGGDGFHRRARAAGNGAEAGRHACEIYHRDSPASMSVHEEGTIGVDHADDGRVQ